MLRSTGARVGEVVEIDRDGIDWQTGDILICGEKGGRYRTLYLDEVARYHLKKYLDQRTDDNAALFVSCKKPFGRLHTSGIRSVLKQIAKREGMQCRVYPHKLRKTLGMNLKNIGNLLNHKHIYFVPFGQDDPVKKPNSMIADTRLLIPTILQALKGRQYQPVLIDHKK